MTNIRTAGPVGEIVFGTVVVDDVVVSGWEVVVGASVGASVSSGCSTPWSPRNPISYTWRRHELPQSWLWAPVHGMLYSKGSVGMNDVVSSKSELAPPLIRTFVTPRWSTWLIFNGFWPTKITKFGPKIYIFRIGKLKIKASKRHTPNLICPNPSQANILSEILDLF